MNHYDPLGQFPPPRSLNHRVSDYTDTDAGRSNYYGTPNMGGPPVHRGNEAPSRDAWFRGVTGRNTSSYGEGDDGLYGQRGPKKDGPSPMPSTPFGGGRPPAPMGAAARP
jgi:hypothetical protein